MTKLLKFHSNIPHYLNKEENKKVAIKLKCREVKDYSHYVAICKIYGATPHYREVFENHLKGE